MDKQLPVQIPTYSVSNIYIVHVFSENRQRLDVANGIQQLRNGVASELLDYSNKKTTKSCTFAERHTFSSISSAQITRLVLKSKEHLLPLLA